jgi:hypothetical protein
MRPWESLSRRDGVSPRSGAGSGGGRRRKECPRRNGLAGEAGRRQCSSKRVGRRGPAAGCPPGQGRSRAPRAGGPVPVPRIRQSSPSAGFVCANASFKGQPPCGARVRSVSGRLGSFGLPPMPLPRPPNAQCVLGILPHFRRDGHRDPNPRQCGGEAPRDRRRPHVRAAQMEERPGFLIFPAIVRSEDQRAPTKPLGDVSGSASEPLDSGTFCRSGAVTSRSVRSFADNDR